MEAIQRGARAIDRIPDGIWFYWEINECDDWGGRKDWREWVPFQSAKEKIINRTLKLSFSNIHTSDYLNLPALTEFLSHDNLTTPWDYINCIHWFTS
jgi:hypothetical protein